MKTISVISKRFPYADLHYDGAVFSRENLESIAEMSAGHDFSIWVCYDNAASKWFKKAKATKEICHTVKKYGKLGIWILSEKQELVTAVEDFEPDIIETAGQVKPEWIKHFQTLKESFFRPVAPEQQ